MTDYFGYTYAALVAAGGVMGYVKAGSTVSLGMGLLFGGLSAIGAYQVSSNPSRFHMMMGTSSILAVVMGMKVFKTGNLLSPAGIVTTLSILAAVRFVPRLLEGSPKSA